MRAVLSPEADATYFPSGLKHTLLTRSVCPCVVGGGCAVVAGRHKRCMYVCMHASALMLRVSARARVGARTGEMVSLALGFELRRRVHVQGLAAMGDVYLGHGLHTVKQGVGRPGVSRAESRVKTYRQRALSFINT